VKISIIGAGNVGSTLAKRVLEADIADVIILDIAKEMAQAKALDLMHSASAIGISRSIIGTDDYACIKESNIIVITAGFPRQPGMSRADLIGKNSAIIKDVIKNIKVHSPNAIVIVVTNPLDLMAFLAYKESGFDRNKVIGMAGALDTSRFAYIISKELKVPIDKVETIVLGQHSTEMVPIISHTKISGKPLSKVASKETISKLIEELRQCGATIVKLLGKGSAYYAPSAAALKMVMEIALDKKEIISASVLAQGKYGISGVYTGLPVRLGKNGIEEIVELKLDKDELEALKSSSEKAKEAIAKL